MRRLILLLILLWGVAAAAQPVRWGLGGDGGIYWKVRSGVAAAAAAHIDHLEMAGKGMAGIVYYGVDARGGVILRQQLVFPGLRILPNDTRGSYTLKLAERVADSITIDGQPIAERPSAFYIKGILKIVSRTQGPLVLERTIFPSVDKRAYFERYVLTNRGNAVMKLHLPVVDKDSVTDGSREAEGPFVVTRRTYDGGDVVLLPG